MEKFQLHFGGVALGELIFRHADNLSKTLQSSKISAAEGQRVAELTVATLERLRCEEQFSSFWELLETKRKKDANIVVSEPELPKQRKPPAKLGEGLSCGYYPQSVEAHYRRYYFESLDLAINSIKNRFASQAIEPTKTSKAFCSILFQERTANCSIKKSGLCMEKTWM